MERREFLSMRSAEDAASISDRPLSCVWSGKPTSGVAHRRFNGTSSPSAAALFVVMPMVPEHRPRVAIGSRGGQTLPE